MIGGARTLEYEAMSTAIDELLRDTTACHTREDLERKLARGRPLRVKFGVDPSAPDLHLGHAVPLGYLRRLQDLGHVAVLIVGDVTAQVGDPTGRNRTRPQLSPEQVEANARTYLEQARLVLDLERTEIVRNGDWFGAMDFMDALRMAATSTVARMMERDTFAERFEAGEPIGVHEMLYPLMQARDSVEVRADVEIGGTDQTFNLLVGRDVMRDAGLEPQVCVTVPILVGTDGARKMSKSLGNAVGLTDPPSETFGRVMSIPDELMEDWFRLATDLAPGAIAAELARPPREAKAALARAIVRRYHGATAAAAASDEFDRVFREGGLPDEIPELQLDAGEVEEQGVWIVRALQRTGLASSSSAARRLLREGGVRIDGDRVGDEQARLARGGSYLLQVGKRRFHRVTVPGG